MTTQNRELASLIDNSGNVTATGNLTVSGTTTTISSTVQTIADPLIEINTGAGSNSNDLGFVFERGSTGDNACLIWDESNDVFAVGTTTATGTSTGNMSFSAAGLTAGVGTFSSLDISGDADIDGTLEADAITIDGVTLAETISDTVGAMVGSNTETGVTVTYDDSDNTLDFVIGTLNQDTTGTAAIATTVTITDNESTNEENAVVFTAGGDVDGGNLGLESDGNLTYNPSSGTLTSTAIAGTLSTAAQGNVTSLGTLTTLTVDNVIVNGTTIGHTDDTDLLTLADGVLTVAGEVSMTTLDIGGTNVTSTAAELNFSDGVTSNIQTQLDTKTSTGKAIAMAIVFG